MDLPAKLKLQYNHNDEQSVALSPALWSALASDKQDITGTLVNAYYLAIRSSIIINGPPPFR